MIANELMKLAHSAIIELFVIDATNLGGGVHRFHNGTNQLRQAVVWRGESYQPFPIEASGFDTVTEGPMPRPTVRVSNALGLMGLINRSYSSLKGARFIRRRTLARFLDAVNYPGGVNPDASPSSGWPDDLWIIDRKTHQDDITCEYQLASPLDVAGTKLPRRLIIARVCGVEGGYRSADCGYAGGPVADKDDNPTTDPALDDCSMLPSGCKLRFQDVAEGVPFGGFPGVGQFRSI